MAGMPELLTLADGLSRNGCQVDFLLVVKRGELLADVPGTVRLIELGTVSRTMLLPHLVGLRGSYCLSC